MKNKEIDPNEDCEDLLCKIEQDPYLKRIRVAVLIIVAVSIYLIVR